MSPFNPCSIGEQLKSTSSYFTLCKGSQYCQGQKHESQSSLQVNLLFCVPSALLPATLCGQLGEGSTSQVEGPPKEEWPGKGSLPQQGGSTQRLFPPQRKKWLPYRLCLFSFELLPPPLASARVWQEGWQAFHKTLKVKVRWRLFSVGL